MGVFISHVHRSSLNFFGKVRRICYLVRFRWDSFDSHCLSPSLLVVKELPLRVQVFLTWISSLGWHSIVDRWGLKLIQFIFASDWFLNTILGRFLPLNKILNGWGIPRRRLRSLLLLFKRRLKSYPLVVERILWKIEGRKSFSLHFDGGSWRDYRGWLVGHFLHLADELPDCSGHIRACHKLRLFFLRHRFLLRLLLLLFLL